jgi:hypothetical protein
MHLFSALLPPVGDRLAIACGWALAIEWILLQQGGSNTGDQGRSSVYPLATFSWTRLTKYASGSTGNSRLMGIYLVV